MSKEQITKVWAAIAIVLLFYALNTYISSQGGAPLFGVPLLTTQRETAALYALIICPPMLFVAVAFGELYLGRYGAKRKWLGIPPAFIGELDVGHRESRAYLVAVVVLAYVVPMLSFFHFARIVAGAELCVKEVTIVRQGKEVSIPPTKATWLKWDLPESEFWLEDRYRLAGKEAGSDQNALQQCTGGASFTPLLEPAFLVLWCGFAVIYAVFHLGKLAGIGNWYRKDVSDG